MTIKEYLSHHPKCLKRNSFEKVSTNYVVTWRIPKAISIKHGRPFTNKQIVNGFHTKKEAESQAKNVQRYGATNIKVVYVGGR